MEKDSIPLERFLGAIKTESTKKSYVYWLDRFKKHMSSESYEEMLFAAPMEIENSIIDYVIFLKKTRPRSSIELAIYPLFLFYAMNRVTLNEKIIKKAFPVSGVRGGSRGYTKDEVRAILAVLGKSEDFVTLRKRAMIHILASSGMRLGALPLLRLSDFRKMEKSYCITIYQGTKDQYYSFLTPESSRVFDQYIESYRMRRTRYDPDDFVFDIKYGTIAKTLQRIIMQAHIRTKDDLIQKRWNTSMAHSFRKRLATILKNAENPNQLKIEKILGHTIGLDESYYKPTIPDLYKEYAKSIQLITLGKPRKPRDMSYAYSP